VIWSNLEYVSLRLIRRFLFTGATLDRLGAFVPYWRVNQGRMEPGLIVDAFQRLLLLAGVDVSDGCARRVVELGCGAANGTGHEWTARFGGCWTGVEPFAPFDQNLDDRLAESSRRIHRRPGSSPVSGESDRQCPTNSPKASVVRVKDLSMLPDASADIIVSNSVLEHVSAPEALFAECARVLATGGAMLHQIDYRDHFFKYPFHFLTFSRDVWENLLNPGDLPRLRLDDHLQALGRCGFQAEILERETAPESLAAVTPFLAPEFAGRDKDMLATATAALFCRKSP
jgi:SAM-dependent methyltransferase